MYRPFRNTSGFLALLGLIPAVLVLAYPSAAGSALSLAHYAQLQEAPAAMKTDSVPWVLSPRVGEEIDREERTYFHLFPAVRGFDKASTFRKSTGDIAFIITRRDTAGGVSDTTVTVSSETAEQIAVFVDNYEPICSRMHYFDFLPVKEYVRLPAISCTTTRPVRVALTDGTEYVAQILHAADNALVLWKTDGVYDWQAVGDNGAFLPYHMIHAVIYKEGARFKRGLTCGGLGCLIGGVAGALMGLAAGDDPEDQWLVSNTAEQKAFMGGLGCGLFGGAAGGLFGVIGGAGESRLIRGSYQTYQNSRPSLNQRAVFPYGIPPEISYLLESKHSPTEQ